MANQTNKKYGILVLVAVVIIIGASFIFTSGGSSIVGTWESEDGYAVMFGNNGALSDSSNQFSPATTYSVDNGKLHIIDSLTGRHEVFGIRRSGNTLILSQDGYSTTLTKR